MSVEDPFEVSKVVCLIVREEDVLVRFDRIFSMLFENILLNPIVSELDIFTLIDFVYRDKKCLLLIFCEKVRHFFDTFGLVNPLISHEEGKKSADLITSIQCLDHFISIFFMLLS